MNRRVSHLIIGFLVILFLPVLSSAATSLSIVSTTPASITTNSFNGSYFVLRVSGDTFAGGLTTSNIVLHGVTDGSVVNVQRNSDTEIGISIVFFGPRDRSYNGAYFSLTGACFTNATTTVKSPSFNITEGDTSPPQITAQSPQNGSTGVGLTNLSMSFTFNEPVMIMNFGAKVTIKRKSNGSTVAEVPFTSLMFSSDSKTLSFYLSATLDYGTEYYVTVPGSNSIRDYYNNYFLGSSSWSFTTTDLCPITFDKQGGYSGTSTVNAKYGDPMPTATAPQKTSHEFVGYFSATSGGTKYYDANMSSVRNWDILAPTTLYAQWIAVSTNVRDSIVSDTVPATVSQTVYDGPVGKEDTINSVAVVDSITDSLWNITDTLHDGVVVATSAAAFASVTRWVDTVSYTADTLKYQPEVTQTVRDSLLSDSVPATLTATYYDGPVGKEDTITTVAVVDTITDSLWNITDTLHDGVVVSSATAVFVSATVWVDTVSYTADTLEYQPEVTQSVRDSIVSDTVPHTQIDTAYVGTEGEEDTVITTTVLDTITDSLWNITDTLYDGSLHQSSAPVFVKDTVWIDTVSTSSETKEYVPVTAIGRTNTLQSSSDITFAPNPVHVSDGEVFFTTPARVEANWSVTIYDVVGNLIDRQEFYSGGGYVYRWDLRNRAGVPVVAGTYVAIIEVELSDGTRLMTKRSIGVRR